MLDSFFQKLELNPSPIPKAQKKLKPKKFRPVPALKLSVQAFHPFGNWASRYGVGSNHSACDASFWL